MLIYIYTVPSNKYPFVHVHIECKPDLYDSKLRSMLLATPNNRLMICFLSFNIVNFTPNKRKIGFHQEEKLLKNMEELLLSIYPIAQQTVPNPTTISPNSKQPNMNPNNNDNNNNTHFSQDTSLDDLLDLYSAPSIGSNLSPPAKPSLHPYNNSNNTTFKTSQHFNNSNNNNNNDNNNNNKNSLDDEINDLLADEDEGDSGGNFPQAKAFLHTTPSQKQVFERT